MTRVLHVTGVAAGGDGIAREAGGRVVFVDGALPGEDVEVELVDERRGYARARVTRVVRASDDRVAPPCPATADGCGGCGWQHVARDAQLGLKRAIVEDAFRRVAKLAPPEEVRLVPLPSDSQRTTVRAAVVDGRAGFRRRQSHDVVTVAGCGVAHPLVAELLVDGRFGRAGEVTLRAGAATGERLVITDGPRRDVRVPEGTDVVTERELDAGREAAVHEVVAGMRWRVSARSFFQSGPAAAAALVEEVWRQAAESVDGGGHVVDLYAGVGLLGGVVAARSGAALVAVESSASSVRDARANLRGLGATVVRKEVGDWSPREVADVTIADPARAGWGARAWRRSWPPEPASSFWSPVTRLHLLVTPASSSRPGTRSKSSR